MLTFYFSLMDTEGQRSRFEKNLPGERGIGGGKKSSGSLPGCIFAEIFPGSDQWGNRGALGAHSERCQTAGCAGKGTSAG